MNRSHIVNQDQMYARFDDQANTKLVGAKQIQPGFSYRRVHFTHESDWRMNKGKNEIFADPQYQINTSQLSRLDNKNPNVILKRLWDLYQLTPKSQKPQFFPTKNFNINRIKDHTELPPFVTQIGILPVQHYKSLFMTQDFASDGLYQILINQNGRFETDVVDDWIPVYADSLEPIWGMDVEHAWQIILLKFWAKKNRSYYRIKQIPPFQFIEFFTNSNWKYYNLNKEGLKFLDFYTGRIPNGKFVLKTKSTNQVSQAGLIPCSAGYQLLDLQQTTGKQAIGDKKWTILVRSTLINKWTGDMSVLDKQINSKYQPQKYKMALQRDFMMNHPDFLNLFSACFIASRRQKHNYFTDYYLLDIPQNNKHSVYLKFDVKQPGWFDFCVKQFDDNRVQFTSNKSRLKTENENRNMGIADDGKRFIKVKFILVRDTNTGGRQSARNTDPQYNPSRFDVYQIQYLHGYNRGDARFQNIIPGTYYLRIKPQKIIKPCKFVVNYSSNSRIVMQQVNLSKQQTSLILRQSMASMIEQLTSYSLDITKKYQQIVFANLFEEVGYGFVGVRIKKICPYRILIQIDPKLVQQSGYKLKNQFKTMNQPFSIIVQKGQSTSVVLKKVNPSATWPPKGIQIFKERTTV